MSRRDIFTNLVVLTAMVLMSACGSCGTASNPSPTTTPAAQNLKPINNPTKKNLTLPADVCTLVTVDDAATAFGVDKTEVAAQPTGAGSPICIYGNNKDNQGGIFVIAESYPDAATADQVQPEQLAAMYSRLYGIANAKSVTGIGDKAFEYNTTSTANGSAGAAIFAVKSNIMVVIFLTPASDTSGVEKLAKAAFSRLS